MAYPLGLRSSPEASQSRRGVFDVFEDVQHEDQVVLPRGGIIRPKSGQLNTRAPLWTRIY